MSQTSKRQSPSGQQDKADLLSLLQVVERLYESYTTVLNSHTQNALLLSLILEAQTLLDKLRVMNKRWRFHLPFKEACTVKFFDWSKKIERMSLDLDESGKDNDTDRPASEYCPSKHFVLDLYENLREKDSGSDYEPYYRETNIRTFLGRQNEIRKQITGNWSSYKAQFSDATAREVNRYVGDIVIPLSRKSDVIRQTCSDVLRQLSVELNQLDNILTGVFSHDQLIRLTERVINESDYGCGKAKQAARRYIAEIKNTNPEEEWAELFELEIQVSLEKIGALKYGNSVTRFIGESNKLEGHYRGFGRFLHGCRHDITEEDLYELMEQLYRIQYVREEIEQQKAAQKVAEEEERETRADAPEVKSDAASSHKSASEIYKIRTTVKPARPKLPSFFSRGLSADEEATARFYDILHRIGFYIGRPFLPQEMKHPEISCYKGWKWKHLRDALSELGITSPAATQQGMADYLQAVFPYLRADSIKRGFNNKGINKEDPRITERIVSDIKNEFRPVMDRLEKTTL